MCKPFLKLLLFLVLFVTSDLKAFYGTSKVPVRDRYFSIDYANYGYQLDTLLVLRNPTRGSLSVSNRSFLEYTTQNYSIIDTIVIALSYSDPYDTTNTSYSDTIEMYLDVLGRANTISSFYAIPGPLSAEFFNASSSDSTKLTYNWDFDDGSVSSQLNPKHQFSSSGTYNVCLTAYSTVDSNHYCESVTVFDSTFIQANPDVLYYYYPDSAAYTTLKDNDLFYGNASVSVSRQGLYGQASISNGVLKYTVDSFVNYAYDMVEYVLNNGTVTDTGVVYIYHYLRQDYAFCQPDFNYSSSLTSVNFSNTTKCGSNNSAKSYYWEFGDSSFSTQKNPAHTYTTYGTYNVCIETTDSFNVKLKTCKFIYVYDNRCQPEFGYVAGINQVSLYPSENCPDALAYEWDFGDSSTSSELYPVHQYATTGTYSVCLTKFGFTDTVTVCKSVTVLDTNALIAMEDYVVHQYSANEVEVKVLSNDIFYQNASLSLVTQPSLVDARVAGSKLYLKSKRLIFTGEEQFEYSICKGGNCDTTRVSLTLIPLNDLSDCKPEIDYTISGTSIQLDVTDNCNTGDSLIAFYWYFSDGDTAMQRQAVHDFIHPGLYSVSLTAFDTSGRASYANEIICIVDSSINNGNLLAVDDQLSTNIFSIGNRYNVLYNDVNLNFKKAYTTAIKDFNHGLTLFDTMGNLMWLPDSAYRGCDTMQYAVFSKDNSGIIDTATVFICFEDFPWCIDSTLIDTSYNCGTLDMP
ncbi:MAG: PKD domain-containing protein, partial [Chitinophagaceae bacterium]